MTLFKTPSFLKDFSSLSSASHSSSTLVNLFANHFGGGGGGGGRKDGFAWLSLLLLDEYTYPYDFFRS